VKDAKSRPLGRRLRFAMVACGPRPGLQYRPGPFLETMGGRYSDPNSARKFGLTMRRSQAQTRQLRPSGPPAETRASRATRLKLRQNPMRRLDLPGLEFTSNSERGSTSKTQKTRLRFCQCHPWDRPSGDLSTPMWCLHSTGSGLY